MLSVHKRLGGVGSDWKQRPGLSASQTDLPVRGRTLSCLRPEAHQSHCGRGESYCLLETRKRDSEREEIDTKGKTQKASRERL